MENILINIDSRFRNKNIYPNSGKFTFNLGEKIKNVTYIRLSSVEIPNLYFTFSDAKDNSKFIITTNNNGYNIHIEEGFYDSCQLLQNIQELLEPIPGNHTIKLNLANGYVTFESDTDFSIDFSNNGIYPSLGYQLGFRNNNYNSQSKIVNGTVIKYIKGESQLDVIGDNYLFLKVNDYGLIYNFRNSDNITTNENVNTYLGKVIMSVNKTEKNFDNNNFITKKHIFRQPNNISKFDIELLDPLNRIVDLVYMDFSFTLEVGVIYDKSVYDNYLNNINYQMMLNDLEYVSKKEIIVKEPDEKLFNNYNNDKSNNCTVDTPNNQLVKELLTDVFNKNIEIQPIDEFVFLEEKKQKKKNKHKIKNKFGIQY
jgi:hypothetical protein